MIRVCLLLMVVLNVTIICHGQDPQVAATKLETTYDETFVKITNAKKLDITFDRVKFELGALQLEALQLLASKMD